MVEFMTRDKLIVLRVAFCFPWQLYYHCSDLPNYVLSRSLARQFQHINLVKLYRKVENLRFFSCRSLNIYINLIYKCFTLRKLITVLNNDGRRRCSIIVLQFPKLNRCMPSTNPLSQFV